MLFTQHLHNTLSKENAMVIVLSSANRTWLSLDFQLRVIARLDIARIIINSTSFRDLNADRLLQIDFLYMNWLPKLVV